MPWPVRPHRFGLAPSCEILGSRTRPAAKIPGPLEPLDRAQGIDLIEGRIEQQRRILLRPAQSAFVIKRLCECIVCGQQILDILGRVLQQRFGQGPSCPVGARV